MVVDEADVVYDVDVNVVNAGDNALRSSMMFVVEAVAVEVTEGKIEVRGNSVELAAMIEVVSVKVAL